jgi:hypothetical protein
MNNDSLVKDKEKQNEPLGEIENHFQFHLSRASLDLKEKVVIKKSTERFEF